MSARIYLDHAATTPPRPEALAALRTWLDHAPGNASAAHGAGQAMRVAVEEARERIAVALGAEPSEIVLTASGTEADNLALKGVLWAAESAGRRHLVVTAVEHPAVLESARWLARRGCEVTVVAPRRDGTVDPEAILAAARPGTALVSVMSANNETGAINDVAAIAAALAERDVPLHTDAVQAVATLPQDARAAGVAALALSGHKLGAPQGVGAAYLRRGLAVEALVHGGGQERDLRAGTYAAALDAALGAALTASVADRDRLSRAARAQTDRLASALLGLGGITRTGPAEAARRLATHLHVAIDGVDGEALTFALDRAGLAVSAGAACGAGAVKRSHVVDALAIDADAVLRLSVGWTTTDAEIEAALDVLTDVIPRLRAGAPVVA